MIHKKIIIHGSVQGVGFRYSARKIAYHLGINGFVRNLPDGSVFIEAEGHEDAMEEFIRWCHTGPSRAIIQSVSIEEGPPVQFSEFKIAF
ncbi:MAG: acylphosphatase [Bacteroidales bacterium]|nr:acylphosphatase [Bacteroidales bacterium]